MKWSIILLRTCTSSCWKKTKIIIPDSSSKTDPHNINVEEVKIVLPPQADSNNNNVEEVENGLSHQADPYNNSDKKADIKNVYVVDRCCGKSEYKFQLSAYKYQPNQNSALNQSSSQQESTDEVNACELLLYNQFYL